MFEAISSALVGNHRAHEVTSLVREAVTMQIDPPVGTEGRPNASSVWLVSG